VERESWDDLISFLSDFMTDDWAGLPLDVLGQKVPWSGEFSYGW
jgi:hypothetical protein